MIVIVIVIVAMIVIIIVTVIVVLTATATAIVVSVPHKAIYVALYLPHAAELLPTAEEIDLAHRHHGF